MLDNYLDVSGVPKALGVHLEFVKRLVGDED